MVTFSIAVMSSWGLSANSTQRGQKGSLVVDVIIVVNIKKRNLSSVFRY